MAGASRVVLDVGIVFVSFQRTGQHCRSFATPKGSRELTSSTVPIVSCPYRCDTFIFIDLLNSEIQHLSTIADGNLGIL